MTETEFPCPVCKTKMDLDEHVECEIFDMEGEDFVEGYELKCPNCWTMIQIAGERLEHPSGDLLTAINALGTGVM